MKKLVNCWGDRPQIPKKSVSFVRDQSQSLTGLSVPRPSVAKSVLLSASESALPRHIDGCCVRLRFDVKGHWHWHQCQPYLIILDVTTVLSVKGILSHSIGKSCYKFGPILLWERPNHNGHDVHSTGEKRYVFHCCYSFWYSVLKICS